MIDTSLHQEIENILGKDYGVPQSSQASREIIATITKHSELFRGPLPHPRHLADYEQIQSGTAGQIISMAIKEQAHRHDWERKEQVNSRNLSALGLIIGGMVALSLIGGAIYCATINQPWIAGALLAAVSVSMVPSIIDGGNSFLSRSRNQAHSAQGNGAKRSPSSRSKPSRKAR
jgi:uncharacterized membrane protein